MAQRAREPAFDRRTVLKLSGTAFSVAGLAGCAGFGNSDDEPDNSDSTATKIELGGKVGGWQGKAPKRIEGKVNPTLQLTAGTTYELTWENLDGVEHELIIEDGTGTELEATESASEKGATRTITFEATETMAQYYCEYHPQSMRGDI